ncbi:hypothetical protein DM02DRAFT_38233 [Periconia macrospinosa]|uniref:Uncharacterized protein n=1 Tax=Periconia macrospinosa TaxID=97972 RepID=A0A2V1EAE7_9PLEO|nr:hypothetical protein DM02DRAFT_38233 [Periconia macrospinosa]
MYICTYVHKKLTLTLRNVGFSLPPYLLTKLYLLTHTLFQSMFIFITYIIEKNVSRIMLSERGLMYALLS